MGEKEKILQFCQRIGAGQLQKYVLGGVVTLDELIAAGLQPEKVEFIRAVEDEPWHRILRQNTIDAYQEYARLYPNKHQKEVQQRIEMLEDEACWQQALGSNSAADYRRYLDSFPNGQHCDEAVSLLDMMAYREKSAHLLEDLQNDPNAYSAADIRLFADNGAVRWNQLEAVFGPEKLSAIQHFERPSELPDSLPPDHLQKNTTEVYFWGTPSSGKTCALGALISRMESKGILEKLSCGGYNYMTRLSNIFSESGFCTFPDSTSVGSIQEMILQLRDEKHRYHKMTLIDMAGELFRSVYFKRHNLFLDQAKDDTLGKAMSYLKDTRNNKIHFFVVEYGAHDREWEGLRMKDYLDDMVGFLKENNIFRRSTVGVYLLVTKCDMIPGPREGRPKAAFDYITSSMPSFWNTLQDACRNAGVRDLSVLSYSVGDVFAQKLCRFDPQDTEKVIRRLMEKTPAEGGRFDWLKS